MLFMNIFKRKSKRSTRTSVPAVEEHIPEFKEGQVREWFASCGDVNIETIHTAGGDNTVVILIYCPGLCDTKLINQVVSSPVSLSELESQKTVAMKRLPKQGMKEKIIENVFCGQLLLLFEGTDAVYTVDISARPQRKPEEPSTETAVRGPRDGFIEELDVNVGLIRKRLKTTSLHYETFTIGTRTKTEIGLFFIKDVASSQVIEEVRKRLGSIEIDGMLGTEQLEEMIADTPYPFFPLFVYTGRPDLVAESLLRGRFALFVDGNPTAIIAPANLLFVLKTSEDMHDSFFFVSFERFLRLGGMMVALFLPGFWVALTTYHPDQLPFTLLATTMVSRQGVPFSTPLECFLMLFLFELFREAGARFPAAIGQTISVVGGLIIGQAAISAGLTSPGLIVVAATSLVAKFTLGNLYLTGSVALLRMCVLIASSFLGMFGFFISVFAILTYLANLRSFGVPYLAPLSPPVFSDMKHALFRIPWKQEKKRSTMLQPHDSTRQGEDT
ncbi:GerA spore germination protein [Aneurinibacillus soli]|uniref:Spore germination protein XA n=1 Tax=Aneurinibacillus soli TaxID=1500254 RepID=A0A0U5AQ90_9BACL|nr:spore germination protein [Aneurinibacillus soli]PYE58068.1 GerA spore germination protein [Aneurinibacillus soli]BAU25969.1 Spore germination protein XA [Aneurinibacillus soli]